MIKTYSRSSFPVCDYLWCSKYFRIFQRLFPKIVGYRTFHWLTTGKVQFSQKWQFCQLYFVIISRLNYLQIPFSQSTRLLAIGGHLSTFMSFHSLPQFRPAFPHCRRAGLPGIFALLVCLERNLSVSVTNSIPLSHDLLGRVSTLVTNHGAAIAGGTGHQLTEGACPTVHPAAKLTGETISG